MDRAGENLLVVVLDSVRARNLTPYGADRDTFTATDGFFRTWGGRRYAAARAPSVWSLPSHVSMLTGTPAAVHGVTTNDDRLRADATTVFDRLRDDGVATAVFGDNPYLDGERFGLRDGFDTTATGSPELFADSWLDHLRNAARGGTADRHCTALREWVEAREGPWAAWVTLMDAHTPYLPETNAYGRRRDLLRRRYVQYDDSFERSPAAFDRMEALYDGCVRALDRRVARLLRRLADAGRLDDTHVVVTSDHGEGFGEPNVVCGDPVAFHYDCLNDELLHVPLYERRPGQTDFAEVAGLATTTRLPAAVRGGSFETQSATASVRYGGNVDVDAPWTGATGRVVYENRADGVAAFVDDPRGTWASTGADAAATRATVDAAFAAHDGEQLAAGHGAADDGLEERLAALGYG
jgi:arylsulfatase A-like enzyme